MQKERKEMKYRSGYITFQPTFIRTEPIFYSNILNELVSVGILPLAQSNHYMK